MVSRVINYNSFIVCLVAISYSKIIIQTKSTLDIQSAFCICDMALQEGFTNL